MCKSHINLSQLFTMHSLSSWKYRTFKLLFALTKIITESLLKVKSFTYKEQFRVIKQYLFSFRI